MFFLLFGFEVFFSLVASVPWLLITASIKNEIALG